MTMGPLQNGFDQRIEVNVVKSSLARLYHENEKRKTLEDQKKFK